MTTTTTLPALDDAYTLSPKTVESFRTNGHALTRGLASSEEINAYLPSIDKAVENFKAQAYDGIYEKPIEEREAYFKAFLQIENLWEHDATVKQFAFAKRFAKVAAQLLGVPGVRMFHDQALYKEPSGGFTPWHQDQYYWPVDSDQTITLWMPLVDTGTEMGTLLFADGSHHAGADKALPISETSEEYFKGRIRDENYRVVGNEMWAGDATWHYGWTLHKAGGNATPKMRKVICVIYFADGIRLTEPTNERQQVGKFVGHKKPGQLVDSEQNPLLWHKDWE